MSEVKNTGGLEGVIAGDSAICAVDPNAGLVYRGYDCDELAQKASFEDVAWLLLHGELPTPQESKTFSEELAAQAAVPEAVASWMKLMPASMRSMDFLRTGVSMLAAFDPDLHDLSHQANLRKATRLLARTSTLVTSGWRITHRQQEIDPGPGVTFAARFLHCLTGKKPESWQVSAFNLVLILYAEHEFNASTFAARVIASTLSDMYAAITGAVGALEGALHGGANEEAMKMLRDIGTPEKADAYVTDRLSRREKIMGFGHRVYRKGDSRVPAMRELCRSLGERRGETHWVAVCEKMEELMRERKNLHANLDLYAAPVLYLLEIPSQLNTPMFAVGRMSGWTAHVIEQQDHNRLIRPRSNYTGPPPRAYPK